ncbi:type III secretion protein [Ensifer sp. ENS02]|uniref:type III secretion protein n=1 Tax=Ensifer sp. ENS02 TaxID=2769290 RepID=UPI0017807F85|nr:type III secretion protein [Ensifer sp. ENS02]MBD9524728.1 type III secretion protein [Ensifer sp. ENS02]
MVLLLLAATIAPEDANVLRSLAEVFIEQGEGERALATIQKIFEIEGMSGDLHALTSRALWVNGDIPSARRTFQEHMKSRVLK